MSESDIGVPGALGEAVRRVGEELGVARLDRLWLFPPLARGRTESGLVAAGCFLEGDRRLLVTLSYRAQERGAGVDFHPLLQEEGVAPRDRLPRVMEGVVQRFDAELGSAREAELSGDPAAFEALVEELGRGRLPLHARGPGVMEVST